MKIILLITLMMNLVVTKVDGQQLPINYNLNLKSSLYVRIFDGFQLKDNELPTKFIISKVLTTKDSIRLKRMGINIAQKPYMILSSNVSDVRQFIYTQAKVNTYYEGFNLPIILNGELITFGKYNKLEKIDTNKISRVIWLKVAPKYLKNSELLPFGAILVTLRN